MILYCFIVPKVGIKKITPQYRADTEGATISEKPCTY